MFLPKTPPKFEMKAFWSLQQLIGYLGTWSAISKYWQSEGEDPLVEIAARLEQHWGDTLEEKEISWPLSLRIGINE